MPRWTPALVQAGGRPALVISPKQHDKEVGRALMCAITSRLKGCPFEVELPEGLDWRARRAARLGSVPDPVMQEVTARILALVDPEE